MTVWGDGGSGNLGRTMPKPLGKGRELLYTGKVVQRLPLRYQRSDGLPSQEESV